MDRQIVYVGQIPQDTDLLLTNKNVMTGLGYLAQALLGTGTYVDGLACTPTSPATLTVNVGPGSIYAQEEVDATAYGSIAADTADLIVKQGVVMTTANLSCPAPSTSGYSVVYLVEATYQDNDTGSTVLPYYNASNPAVAYSGPDNTGVSQNTTRQGLCKIQVKTGVAAPTGTQTTPAPDAGFTGLYAVTVANGQSAVTSGNIVQLSTAPFLNPKLPSVPSYIQNGTALYAADTSGAANTITVSLTPAVAALTAGMRLNVKVANANTGAAVINTNGLGNVGAYLPNGAALPAGVLAANGIYSFLYDGNHWQFQGDSSLGFQAGTVTAASHTYASADSQQLLLRSNAGAAMTDTLPGTSGALANGWIAYVENTDATASLTVSVGSGGTINQGAATGSLIILPGETWLIQSAGSGVYYAGRILPAVLHAAPPQSTRKKLAAAWSSNTAAQMTADAIVVQDGNGNTRTLKNYSQTLNTGTSGAGGLDTGALAANTWYYVYAIFNPGTNTQGILFSASATSPTLPSGYTFASGSISAILTDGSSNLIGFFQKGRRWQYAVGSNLSGHLPLMASGSAGSLTPTWASIAVGGFVPTAVAASIKLHFGTISGTVLIAPNNSYTAGMLEVVTTHTTMLADFILESTNIYWASSDSTGFIECEGFTINI